MTLETDRFRNGRLWRIPEARERARRGGDATALIRPPSHLRTRYGLSNSWDTPCGEVQVDQLIGRATISCRQAQVLYVGWGGDRHYNSAADITSATLPTHRFQSVLNPSTTLANFYDTLTLAQTTTLDFFISDGFLPDNIGGVALNLTSVGAPSPVPGAGFAGFTALALAGLYARVRRA